MKSHYLDIITGGFDVSIYFVNDSKLSEPGVLQRRKLYPACLPSILHKNNDGLFAGWRDPIDMGRYYKENFHLEAIKTVDQYREEQLVLRHIRVKNITCKDPEWMKTNTYYPKGKL